MVKKNSPGKGWLFGGFSAVIASFGKSYGQKKRKFMLIWPVIICYNLNKRLNGAIIDRFNL